MLYVVSWNLAGLTEEFIDDFLEHTAMEHPWDVLLLQETFRKTEGVKHTTPHTLITAPELEGILICPTIVVHGKLAGAAKCIGGGTRWVAVEIAAERGRPTLFMPAHRPHARSQMEKFNDVLHDMDKILKDG